MASLDAAGFDTKPHQNIAAKALHQRRSLSCAAGAAWTCGKGAFRKPLHDLLDHREALLNLADAHPDTGVDVAVIMGHELEIEFVIRDIARLLSRVECAAASAPHIAASPKLLS